MVYQTGKSLCDEGVIKAQDCSKLKRYYNESRLVYIAMGDALIIAINTEDAVRRKTLLDEYDRLAIQYVQLSGQLIRLSYELGILKGGN